MRASPPVSPSSASASSTSRPGYRKENRVSQIEPFHLAVAEEQLADLFRRLDDTRWPEKETVDDWSQGVPLEQVQALCAHWRARYDWRRCETMLNGLGQ